MKSHVESDNHQLPHKVKQNNDSKGAGTEIIYTITYLRLRVICINIKNDLNQFFQSAASFQKTGSNLRFVETFKNSEYGWENFGFVHERKRCLGRHDHATKKEIPDLENMLSDAMKYKKQMAISSTKNYAFI